MLFPVHSSADQLPSLTPSLLLCDTRSFAVLRILHSPILTYAFIYTLQFAQSVPDKDTSAKRSWPYFLTLHKHEPPRYTLLKIKS